MDKFKEHELALVITTPATLTTDELNDLFTEWVESQGWSFGGAVYGLDSKGERE